MKQKNIVATLYLKDGHAVRSMTDFTPVDANVYRLCQLYNDSGVDKIIIFDLSTSDDEHEKNDMNKIEKLNHEWDTERFLETNAASVVLLSSIIGYKKSKCGLFLLTGAVGFFLLQHAFQGWCPPLPIIRKMGVRTAEEISNEKIVFKKIRGDFSKDFDDADSLLGMAEK